MQFDKILGFINEAKANGLKPFIGGNRVGNKGYFIEPTLFTEVPDDAHMAKEEIFGPVLSILKPFKTIEEAIFRANDTKYGLAAVVVS